MHHVGFSLRTAQSAIGIIVVLELLLDRVPMKATAGLHCDVVEETGGTGPVADFSGRNRLLS